MKNEFSNASEAFKRLNPHLGAVAPVVRKPDSRSTLVGKSSDDQGRARRMAKGSRPKFRVGIVAFRDREAIDSDNNTAGCKPLRDAIAASLFLDDHDSQIRWEHGQMETRGEEGCLVRIERI